MELPRQQSSEQGPRALLCCRFVHLVWGAALALPHRPRQSSPEYALISWFCSWQGAGGHRIGVNRHLFKLEVALCVWLMSLHFLLDNKVEA